MHYAFLFMAVVAEVIATSALKSSEGFSRPGPSIVVVTGYAVAFFFLSLTLKAIPVGVAYAIWSGAGIIFISLAGLILFGQKIDTWGMVGMAFIIAGVMIVNFLSNTSAH